MSTHISIFKRVVCSWILCYILTLPIYSQIEKELCYSNYRLDTLATKELRIEIENLNFFQNNEYGGGLMKGYTLPGLWITPKLTYQPVKSLKLEAGIHALWYSGAYKFPNFAYQDISKWKGNQYQRGAHWLPYFRAQIALGKFNFVLGNLHRGSTHELIAPLYDPELNLTADPESGFQILYDNSRFHLDTWINWQSFIFDIDTHQEAFIVGLNTRYLLNERQSAWHGYLHAQGVIQHRGGEQDNTGEVNTLINGAFGGGVCYRLEDSYINSLHLEANLLGYYQQAGSLWPYGKGAALHTSAGLRMGKHMYLQAGYFIGHHFISILGIPYFGTVSTSHKGAVFNDYPKTLHLSFDYSRSFGKHYAVGAKASVYYASPGEMTLSDGSVKGIKNSTNFAVGVYLKTNLSFLLKKFK